MAATATVSKPAKRSASSAWKPARSRPCPSKRRSAASGAKNSSATATTAIASPAGGYVGRFAPSPTGPLHLGSLAAALASYLEARSRKGRWLVRIEDLDRSRAIPGMANQHLRTLERFGLEWDGAVRIQSEHLDVYRAAFEELKRAGSLYPCTCSRAELIALRPPLSPDDDDELHYPGRCRDGVRNPERPAGWRFRVTEHPVAFTDRWQGPRVERVGESSGDFIVKRRDEITAYQLAVVVDDGLQAITDVVRGADLLASTAKQRLLQDALGLAEPGYAHAPVVVGADGHKLAKSRHAVGVDDDAPAARLVTVLELLHQRPPRELARASAAEVLSWARAHWDPSVLKNMLSTRLPD